VHLAEHPDDLADGRVGPDRLDRRRQDVLARRGGGAESVQGRGDRPGVAVTAGNSSPISDGALAALVGTREVADRLGVAPLGRVLGSATVAVEPDRFSVAPVPAVAKLLDRAGLRHTDIDLWEVNEAFAAMVLSTLDGLPPIDRDRVNVNGGAIAIGHPLGASFPRVVVDLCRELRRRGGGLGVATACIGVGQGQAVLVEVG
jgi:acetyl-CoA acyltransferase